MGKAKVKDELNTANTEATAYVDAEVQRRVAAKLVTLLSTGSRPFNGGTYHDTTVQDSQIARIFEELGQGVSALKGIESGFETVSGKERASYARSRSQIRSNRESGKWIAMALVHKAELERAIFTDDGIVRDDAGTRLCFILGVELVFLAGSILFVNRVGKDEDIAQCEQLSRMTSGGRLNGRFAELAKSLNIFSKCRPNDRGLGQDANQPLELAKEFKAKMVSALKFFDPSVFTTREIIEVKNDPPDKVKQVKVGSPNGVLDPDKVCYWASVPESQLQTTHTIAHKMIIPVYGDDGQMVFTTNAKGEQKMKERTITLTEANFKLHKDAGTAPKTNRNGTVSNPEHSADTPAVDTTAKE